MSLHDNLAQAFIALGGKERLSEHKIKILTESYADAHRDYHGIGHQEDMAALDADEQEVIRNAIADEMAADKITAAVKVAGAYHDVVYTHIDRDMSEDIQMAWAAFVDYTSDGHWIVKAEDNVPGPYKEASKVLNTVFALQPGDMIPPVSQEPKLNEFLSACVAAHDLADAGVTPENITIVAAMIEATIPFRQGNPYSELETRLRDAGIVSDQMIKPALKGAVYLANKDVLSFAGKMRANPTQRLRAFLQDSWKLFPESNASFRSDDYTPQDFRTMLAGTHGFIHHLSAQNPTNIFHSYDGFPDDVTMQELQSNTAEVLAMADAYLKAKQVSAGVVEAIASLGQPDQDRLSSLMPPPQEMRFQFPSEPFARTVQDVVGNPMQTEADAAVFAALKDRGDLDGPDISGSPIAAWMYEVLGPESVDALYDTLQKHGNDALLEQLEKTAGPEALKGLYEGLMKPECSVFAQTLKVEIQRLNSMSQEKAP